MKERPQTQTKQVEKPQSIPPIRKGEKEKKHIKRDGKK